MGWKWSIFLYQYFFHLNQIHIYKSHYFFLITEIYYFLRFCWCPLLIGKNTQAIEKEVRLHSITPQHLEQIITFISTVRIQVGECSIESDAAFCPCTFLHNYIHRTDVKPTKTKYFISSTQFANQLVFPCVGPHPAYQSKVSSRGISQ